MKKIIVLAFTFISMVGLAQTKDKKKLTNRLSIKLGTEYRITPIRKTTTFSDLTAERSIIFNLDQHLSGTSINYDISYQIFRNFDIGFSHSFRYDHLYFEYNLNQLEPNPFGSFSVDDSKSVWITDYHFYVKKSFNLKKDKKLYVKLGLSLMNRGTEYGTSEVFGINTDGSIGTVISGGSDLTFFATNLNIGYTHKKFDFGIGAYFISGSSANLNNDENNIILPYFKISYRIF